MKSTTTLKAATPFGALYGLETFAQLARNGSLPGSRIVLTDEPRYQHRGILLDVGRRFM
jgi:N-acetyl-beta-hexosaminidase